MNIEIYLTQNAVEVNATKNLLNHEPGKLQCDLISLISKHKWTLTY